MPQYFFNVRRPDQSIPFDAKSALLPDSAAALLYAERVINEQRKELANDDLVMIVENEAHEIVLCLPFQPAWA